MTDYMKLTDILMDELPEENPWNGNIKGLVEKLIANGVTFATDNNVGDKIHKLLVKSDPISEEKMRELLNGPAIFHTGTESIVPIYPYEWIPASEPPKERGCYLISVKHWLDGKPVTREAFWNGADWLSCYWKKGDRVELTPRVTHWQYLPQPPKGE